MTDYPWLKVTNVAPAKPEGWIIDSRGVVRQWDGRVDSKGFYPHVATDNAYRVYRLEDIKIPEGWEPDGETLTAAFRVPDGCCSIGAVVAPSGPDQRRLCIRKIAPKTKKFVVLETDDERAIKYWEAHRQEDGYWTVRIEERPL